LDYLYPHAPWIGEQAWARLFCDRMLAQHDWAKFLHSGHEQVKLYFLRSMRTTRSYPPWVQPFEPVFQGSHNYYTAEHLAQRPFDVCFIGQCHQTRATVLCDLLANGKVKVDYAFPKVRLEFTQWLIRHSKAKMFLEADGGGHGSDRPWELMSIAPMLYQRTDRVSSAPWQENVHCHPISDLDGHVSGFEIEQLMELLKDTDRLYSIYLAGMLHMGKYFSVAARATRVLSAMNSVAL